MIPGSPNSENLEVLAEKFGTLDLKSIKKNRSGVTKKWTRRARLAEAPPTANFSRAPQKEPPPTSKQPDTDPEGAWNIWD